MEDRTVNGEVSPPAKPLPWSEPLQCPVSQPSKITSQSIISPLSSQDSAAEDVIYAHLDLRTLSKRRSTPAPLRPMHPSAEPIIYEEFNINQDHAEP